jgi:hypothetical protein
MKRLKMFQLVNIVYNVDFVDSNIIIILLLIYLYTNKLINCIRRTNR